MESNSSEETNKWKSGILAGIQSITYKCFPLLPHLAGNGECDVIEVIVSAKCIFSTLLSTRW